MLTLAIIRTAIAAVADLAPDYETAHQGEDNLHAAVLRNIADGELTGDDAAEAARVALTTYDIHFPCYYA